MRALDVAVRLRAVEVAVPGLLRRVPEALRLEIEHLATLLRDERLRRQWREPRILSGRDIGKNGRKRGHVDPLLATHDPDTERLEIHALLREQKLQQHAGVRVRMHPLIIGVEDEVAEGVEDGLAVVEELIILRDMRVMRHDDVRAEREIAEIAIARVRTRQTRELLAAMRHDHAPATARLDLRDTPRDQLEIIPAEGPWLRRRGRDTLGLVRHADHADAARLLEVDRLRRLRLIHARTQRPRPDRRRALLRAPHTLDTRVHRVVIANAPDICVHGFEDARRRRIHTVEEDPAGAVIHRVDQRTLDVRDGVIRAVEKRKHRLREQIRILPALIHVPVETDIPGEYDGSGRFRMITSTRRSVRRACLVIARATRCVGCARLVMARAARRVGCACLVMAHAARRRIESHRTSLCKKRSRNGRAAHQQCAMVMGSCFCQVIEMLCG